MGLHLPLQPGYLLVQHDGQPGVCSGRVGGRNGLGQTELPLTQRGLDRGRLRVPVMAVWLGR